ncbi:MAG: serine/threonine protein kinase [Polyangiaceae bacterium]|nr:serine/threonine protein kinase [Polyangiaceae bacterium]
MQYQRRTDPSSAVPPLSGTRASLFSREAQLRKDAVFAERYVLEAYLGRGTLGTVWVARDTRAHDGEPHRVTLKVLTRCAPIASSREKSFRSEVALATRLSPSQVTRIVDYGVADDTPFVATDLLEGETLERHLRRVGRLSPQQCLWLLRGLAEVMTEAHCDGVLHGELHPSNIFLVARPGSSLPTLKVLDFGVSRRTLLDPASTDAHTLAGWPNDTSPEQAAPTPRLDHRSDMWAIAAILYRCLTGLRPFNPRGDWQQRFAPIASTRPAPPSAIVPAMRVAIDEFFLIALHESPNRRYQSFMELVSAFEGALNVQRVPEETSDLATTSADSIACAQATPTEDFLPSLVPTTSASGSSSRRAGRPTRARRWSVRRTRRGRSDVLKSSVDCVRKLVLLGIALFATAIWLIAIANRA